MRSGGRGGCSKPDSKLNLGILSCPLQASHVPDFDASIDVGAGIEHGELGPAETGEGTGTEVRDWK